MKFAVILPAAGLGKRFNEGAVGAASRNKLELELAGKPIFLRAVERFVHRDDVAVILLAVHPDSISEFRFRWGDKLSFHGVRIVPGGTVERWETVMLALDALAEIEAESATGCTHVAIHDAARPLTSKKLIDDAFEAAAKHGAVIPGLPVNATLKRVAEMEATNDEPVDPLDAILGGAGKPEVELKRVVAAVDRTNVVEIQTPQVFELGLLRRAYGQIKSGEVDTKQITDDAGLAEAMGETVYVTPGEPTNLKVTRPADFELAKLIARGMDEAKDASLGAKRLFGDDDDD